MIGASRREEPRIGLHRICDLVGGAQLREVVNPSLKSDRDRRRRLTALQERGLISDIDIAR